MYHLLMVTNCTVPGLWAVFGEYLFSSLSYQLHYSTYLEQSDLSMYQNFIVLWVIETRS